MKFHQVSFSLLFCMLFQTSFAAGDFYLVVAADPQYRWACGSGTECERLAKGTEDQAILSNKWQTDSINKLVDTYGDAFKGVIVNGDLTAFGHEDEFDGYEKYFKNRIKAKVYPGLGNHDYANNIDDCFTNNCARRMVNYLRDVVESMRPKAVSFDYEETGVYYDFPVLRKDHSGSLAYSFDIEKVHIVQLNNYPSYTTKFNGWNFGSARRDYFDITPSFEWLEGDLKKAHSKGKTILVNLHDFDQHITKENQKKLIDLMAKYQVKAVFWGHLHHLVGKFKKANPTLSFHSGSSPYNTYLLLRFTDSQLVEVSIIDSAQGSTSVRKSYLVE